MALIAIYLLIRRLLLDRRLAAAVAAFTALTPSFIMTSSSVNDDTAGVMFSSLTLLSAGYIVTAARAPLPAVVAMIALMVLSLMSKTAALALAEGIYAKGFYAEAGHAFVEVLELARIDEVRQQALDGIANRCNGQLYQGARTHIGWTAREIVLPTMPGRTPNTPASAQLGASSAGGGSGTMSRYVGPSSGWKTLTMPSKRKMLPCTTGMPSFTLASFRR